LHPHDNMEIITIPLTGELRHEDSMGQREIILPGEIQVMSAGTGLYHSEFNNSEDEELTLLQIWVLPNQRNVTPRYDQIPVDAFLQPNTFRQIVSPSPDDDGAWIHQEAWFHLGIFDAGAEQKQALRKQGDGLYAFVIEGEAVIAGETLGRRDGLGMTNLAEVSISATLPDTKILLIEVPFTA
jgi:quercetin 2,3-dioxygenase